MKNKKLIKEIFKRLEGNFPCLSSPKYAQTGSEIAADALRETLYNIGLDGLYVFRVGLDDLGLWTAYFKVVDVKDEEIEEMWDERRSDFFIEVYGERILKMIGDFSRRELQKKKLIVGLTPPTVRGSIGCDAKEREDE